MDFDCIYKSYYLNVYHFLCGLSSNKEIAEDITQETFTVYSGDIEPSARGFRATITNE